MGSEDRMGRSMSVGLPTPPRTNVETCSWEACWDPDGEQLLVLAMWGNTEGVVLQRNMQRAPADEQELQQWASEAMASLAELWRPRGE